MSRGPRMVSRAARVIRNERVEGGCHHLVAVTEGWPDTGAGQFAMLSTAHPQFPILPRPFSLLGWERKGTEDHLEWMIMPVGVGTAILCSLRPGEALDAVGPLGRRMDEGLPDGELVCVDGVIKLSVNGKVVNGISRTSQKKGYLCLESEGAEIHFRNIKLMELPPGVE